MEQSSNKGLLFGTIAVAALIFVALIWAVLSVPSDSGDTGLPGGPVSFNDENDPAVGPEDASVVVRLFEDLQCPACRAADPGVKYAIENYSDRVRFVWNDFPLQSIHPNARAAANAARCAEEQGKFWEFKDILFAEQNSWSATRALGETFAAYASRLELDVDSFNQCFEEKRHDDKIMADVNEGNRNGVNGTPTIFVNDVMRNGLSPTEWDSILTAALAE